MVHFRKPHFCANFMDMQGTDCSVTHSSTEAEVISLDSGLRKEGLPALTLRNIVIDVLEPLVRPAREDHTRQLKPKTSQCKQESMNPAIVLMCFFSRRNKR